jgi:hypothetical protein
LKAVGGISDTFEKEQSDWLRKNPNGGIRSIKRGNVSKNEKSLIRKLKKFWIGRS